MPIPAADQALLRGLNHIVKPKLNVFPAEVVATATVQNTPSVYPIGEISITNTSNIDQVRVGQLFEIRETTGELVTYGVVRLTPTSNTLFIDGKSRGDSGRTNRLLRAIAAQQIVTIYSFHPLWSMLSRIADDTFFKRFDVPYTDEGLRPDPVLNIGTWQQVDADITTLKGQLSFDALSASFGWRGASVSGVVWEVSGSGAAFIVGSATSNFITLEFDPGFYILYCTITDVNGKTTTGMRPIWVNHSTLYPALSDQYAIQIEGDSQNTEGRTMSIRMFGDDIPEDLILPGAAFLFSIESIYDNQESLSDGVDIDTFVGFIANETPRFEFINGQKSILFEIKSPYQRFADLPMVSQAIVETSAPADWTEVSPGLGEPSFIAYYILKYHTTYMEMFDFFGLQEDSPPRKRNWGLNGSTVNEYLNYCGSIIGGFVGTDSSGALKIKRDPNIEEVDFRSDLDERFTWTEHDIVEPPEFTIRTTPEIGQLKAFAFGFDGTADPVAVASVAPGFTQGQAPGKQDEETIIVGDPSTAQDKINRIAGHFYAKRNNSIPEIQLQITRNMDIFEPIDSNWHRITLPATYDPRGVGINTRCIINNVDRSWENIEGTWLKRITTTFEPESFGQPGETYIVDVGGGSVYPPFTPPGFEGGNFPGFPDNPIDFNQNFKWVLAWNANGDFGINNNGFNWKGVQADLPTASWATADAAIDWNSPYITSGFTSGSLGVYQVAVDQSGSGLSSLRVYYTGDILRDDNVNWIQRFSVTNSDSSVRGSARILTYRGDPNYIAVVWRSTDGTFMTFSQDAGLNWAATFRVYDSANVAIGASDSANAGLPHGADIDADGTVVTSGFSEDLPNIEYRMFRIPKGSSTPILVANSIVSNQPYSAIQLDRSGNGYAAIGASITLGSVAAELNWETGTGVFTNASAFIENGTISLYRGQNGFDPYPLTLGFTGINVSLPPSGTLHPVHLRNIELRATGTAVSSYFVLGESLPPQQTASSRDLDPINVTMFLNGIFEITSVTVNYEAYYTRQDYIVGNFFFNNGVLTPITPLASVAGMSFSVFDNFGTLLGTGAGSLGQEAGSAAAFGSTTFFNPPLSGSQRIEVTSGINGNRWDQGVEVVNNADNSLQYGIRSISITANDAVVVDPDFYRFTDYSTGSATFTVVSPDGIWAPFYHYGIAVDRIAPQIVTIISTNTSGIDTALFTSSNDAALWISLGFRPGRIGIIKQSDAALLFGENVLDISVDGGVTAVSLVGDWATALSSGAVGTIRGALSSGTIA